MDLPNTEATASKRRSYSEDFKRDAVRLIVEESYSFKAASQAVGVSGATLRSWHAQLAPKPKSCGDDATISELQAENVTVQARFDGKTSPSLLTGA